VPPMSMPMALRDRLIVKLHQPCLPEQRGLPA